MVRRRVSNRRRSPAKPWRSSTLSSSPAATEQQRDPEFLRKLHRNFLASISRGRAHDSYRCLTPDPMLAAGYKTADRIAAAMRETGNLDPIAQTPLRTRQAPNELVAPIHNRRPVILSRETPRRWWGEDEAGVDDLAGGRQWATVPP